MYKDGEFFSKNAKEEQRLLQDEFPSLYKYYDKYTGLICIEESILHKNNMVRYQVMRILGQVTADSRYVMYRSELPDENGEITKMGYIICQANIVE